MIFNKIISKEIQLKVIVALIMAMSLVFFIVYHQHTEKKHLVNESELLLYETGKIYSSEISSELTKYCSLSELLAVTFSKNINQPNFKAEAKSILRELLYNNDRMQSISLVVNNHNNIQDSSILTFSFKDSLSGNIIRLNKSKSGISEDFTSAEFSSLSSKVATIKTVSIDQIKILSPEIEQVDGNSVSVIPIVSALYYGKQYIGYLVMHISMEWLKDDISQNEYFNNNLETFVSTGNGQVFALNKNSYLLTEPISKVCFSCQDLLTEKGSKYNASEQDDNLTICFPVQLDKSMENWHICLRCEESVLSEMLDYSIWDSLLIGLFLYLIGITLVFLFINKREVFWQELFKISNGILSANIDLNEFEKDKDITSNQGRLKAMLIEIAKITNWLVSSNKGTVSGDQSMTLDEDQMQNVIVASTKNLHSTILDLNKKLEKSQTELKHNNEFNKGQEKIAQVLQLHYHDLNELSENVIYSIVDLMEISMGAVFLMNTDEEVPVLELKVSYAYSENRNQKKSFKLGESLIGACAAEQRTIYLKKIPENYLSIMSGLGLASPKSVLIVPLLFESKVLGVIELGSLQDFDENKTRFAENAASSFASTLSMAQNNIINSQLLEQTKLQSKELEEHDKKTIEALAELNELHNKTAQSESAVRSKLEAMNNTLMMVEYTTQGVLIDANYKFLNAMHYSIEEIRGNNVSDLLKDDERDELVKIIDNVKIGNFFEGVIRRHTKLGHEKWFLATYTPVYDEEETVEKILFFAVDITRIKMNEEQLKKKTTELSKQVSDLRNLLNK